MALRRLQEFHMRTFHQMDQLLNTAGYGNMGPNDCWWAWLVMVVQSMIGLLMDAVMIGVIFARISHPKCAPPAAVLHRVWDWYCHQKRNKRLSSAPWC